MSSYGGYYDSHQMPNYPTNEQQRRSDPFEQGDLAEAQPHSPYQRGPLAMGQPQETPYASPVSHFDQTTWESPYSRMPQESNLSSDPNTLNRPLPSTSHSSYGLTPYALQDPGVHPVAPEQVQPEDASPLLNNASYANTSFPGSYSGRTDGGYAQIEQSDEQGNMVRYGKIPSRQPRRFKTVKRVELSHGNLVLDCPVPDKLLQMCSLRNEREFTHMRYTAATCDPDDFMGERYTLRQVLYGPPRRTELFIVLTMYNEDDVLLTRTLHGVLRNIQHLCKRDRSKTWGKDGWKKAVVCIVSDGRKKIHSRSLSVLAAMGVYQEGVAKNVVNGKPVTAHIYEYTTQLGIDPDMKPQGSEKGMVPVQILFCLKEKNQKKINSHRWFFNAFGPILQPNVCVLLDVGTQPGPSSIYRLWKAFDVNSNVAGACGEIVALKGKYFSNLINPLVAAQNFEYKMSNILDKPTESVFGYISVLPGAFSAYRYIALQNDDKGHGPLSEYFKGETLHTDPNTDLWTKNMYLAEDRILCWELVSKRNSSWLLHYVKSAYAITDVPDRLPELISQRRRWLNGSFFAAIHSFVHFGYLYRSSHTVMRKAWMHLELVYSIFNSLFAWFALANWYIAFEILTASLGDDSFNMSWAKYVNVVLHYVYLALLVMCFLLAMGNRPQGSNKTFTTAVVIFALITCYMMFAAIFLAVKGIQNVKDAANESGGFDASDVFTNTIFRNIVLSLIATAGLYLLSSIIFLDPWHMITSFVQYLLIAPSFINVINVYAFCNVHDVSWGTKGDTSVETDLGVVNVGTDNAVDVNIPVDSKDIDDVYDDAWAVLKSKPPKQKDTVDVQTRVEDSYRNIRTNVVMVWAISNGALVAIILSTGASSNISTDGTNAKVSGYMLFLLGSIVALAIIRFIGCVTYIIGFLFTG